MLMFAARVVIYISTHKRWTSESENLVSTAFLISSTFGRDSAKQASLMALAATKVVRS